jgi:hypothetical protein
MSSNTKNIYDEHIKPLPREQQVQLLDLLRDALEDGDENGQRHSILELHGLGNDHSMRRVTELSVLILDDLEL